MDHPTRLLEIDQGAGVVAAASGPFKVRTARIAVDFFAALQQPLVAGRGFDSRDLEKDAATSRCIVSIDFPVGASPWYPPLCVPRTVTVMATRSPSTTMPLVHHAPLLTDSRNDRDHGRHARE
jgi:hypothetical protein